MKKIYLQIPALLFTTLTLHAQWSLTGNSIASGNFLGTTNSQNLVFKVNGFVAGTLDASANSNTYYGIGSVSSTSTGSENSAFGKDALHSNTTGSENVAIGFDALFDNSTGSSNTAIGWAAYTGLTGSFNTAVGNFCLGGGSAGNYNSGFGYNTMVGIGANTSYNQAFGANALANPSGGYNNAFGAYALALNSTGIENVGMGDSALYFNTTGSRNTAMGAFAGPSSGTPSLTNTAALGYGATVTASNSIVIGNSSVTSIGGFANWTNFSDGRFKKDVRENVPGIAFIKMLRPVTYNLDIEGVNAFTQGAAMSNDETAIRQKESIRYTGFVAQEVEAAARKMEFDFSGIVAPQNEKDHYGLRYSDFVVPMVKAIQELNTTNDSLLLVIDSLKSTTSTLQSQINSILQQINELKQDNFPGKKATLLQNAPNPFNNSTTIKYYLPAGVTNAQLVITDSRGNVLKDVMLNNIAEGAGQAILNSVELPSGLYYYSLVIDGRNIDTKKMILSK